MFSVQKMLIRDLHNNDMREKNNKVPNLSDKNNKVPNLSDDTREIHY